MESQGLDPLGFVATDYALLVTGLREVDDPASLLDPTDLREGFETWLQGNAVMKRTFRGVALIAGLIERNLPGSRKTGRQATFSSDILYDTLVKYDPDHLLLRVTREQAQRGLVDFGRIEEMLGRIQGRVDHVRAPRVTPLAAPLLLERGRVPVEGKARERLMAEQAQRLLEEAGLEELS
jgi:ATP-dependent Lhr-like helicase